MTERRGTPRAPLEVKIVYENLEDFAAQWTKNVSSDGLFIRTSRPMAVGTRFSLVIRLPEEKRALLLAAEVRWVEGGEEGQSGMGVRISWADEDQEQRAQFAELIARLPASS